MIVALSGLFSYFIFFLNLHASISNTQGFETADLTVQRLWLYYYLLYFNGWPLVSELFSFIVFLYVFGLSSVVIASLLEELAGHLTRHLIICTSCEWL